MSNTAKAQAERRVEVSRDERPICCPRPGEEVWNMHPRVYIDMKDGEGVCPYCGTRYLIKE